MLTYKQIYKISGWLVFAVALLVYFFSAERAGSLWDCGEFILGAHKMQVVHPPGAPLFLILGRIFGWIGDVFSADPAKIAFMVNMVSAVCTAFVAAFAAWSAMILGRLAFVGKDEQPDDNQAIALGFTGLVAGLTTAFCTSLWFSAVEGEVYAMSTFFTMLTIWSAMKWYELPENPQNDKWLIFAIYSTGLSVGVHLLSLLTFPAVALLYYFKKYKKHSFTGAVVAMGIGGIMIYIIQKFIIVGIPTLWGWMELLFVNGFGLPFNFGIIPTFLIVGAIIYFGLREAHKRNSPILQHFVVAIGLVCIAFSTFGAVVIRSSAGPPINMNEPSNAFSLLSYLNREQYGERPLLKGPHFNASPVRFDTKDKYGKVGDRYEVVEKKYSRVYAPKDMMFFPRMAHDDNARKQLYQVWMGLQPSNNANVRPSFGDNLSFFFRYQIGWMYWRYFMWNFSGRQNGEQGYMPMDPKSGHWYTGIKFMDESRLYNEDKMPDVLRDNRARNRYYLIPFILGIIGLLFHAKAKPKDFLVLGALFLITGIGIIVYSNQPPNEPRERDYVLVGSFIVYSIWIGMAVYAIFDTLKKRINPKIAGIVAGVIALIAPVLMVSENFDDHSRKHLKGASNYAANFLNSCDPNAILFTYGDNDTYPLWYAQEIEGVRRDIRVINLSLIAVDWYINQMRRKINESDPVKFTISREAYIGDARNQIPYDNKPAMNVIDALKYIGESHPVTMSNLTFASSAPTKSMFIPVNGQKFIQEGVIKPEDAGQVVNQIPLKMGGSRWLTKQDLAVMDIISSNINDRPIYFALTSQLARFLGLQDYMEVHGLTARIVPVKTSSQANLGVYGVGKVNTDKAYDNIINKFKWGNFDKIPQYVDHSFGPTTMVQRYEMMRTMKTLMGQSKTVEAGDIAAKFFEAFPHFNFPFKPHEISALTQTNFTLEMIDGLLKGNRLDEAKIHLRELANQTAQFLEFYNSLNADELQGFKFGGDDRPLKTQVTSQQILTKVKEFGDTELENEITALLQPYQTQPILN